jgi:hypothetical protein
VTVRATSLADPTKSATASITVLGAQGANLAVGKAASQSSTIFGAAASNAADGNPDGAWAHSSVAHTNFETNAWWQTDLGASASISSVNIWNRTDCCSERLNDYWVFISDKPFGPSDTPSTLQARADVWRSHQTVAPNPSTLISTVGVQGRYVRVQLSGVNFLNLAEVQVFGAFTNLAVGKAASQSSTMFGAAASNAADGNPDGAWAHSSVAHTNFETNAWWQTDLGASASIGSVNIWNRTDCCSERLNDYWVFVSNMPFSPTDTPAILQNRSGVTAVHLTTVPNPSTQIAVNAAGRYIRVQLSGTSYLHLAEVQVFGTMR